MPEPHADAPETEPFDVLNRWTGKVQFTAQISAGIATPWLKLGAAVRWAIGSRVDLSSADLRGASLSGASLSGASLSGANLSSADLRSADLRSADLSGANLSDASLSRADLSGADLSRASLSDANLRDASLSRADLSGADLSRASLSGADLSRASLSDANLRDASLSRADLRPIRADLFDVLVFARDEAPAFLAALRAGRVDGSTYTGTCACLVGTIAKERGVDPFSLTHDSTRPIERFVMGIKSGDTPQTNPVAKLVAEWTEAFIGEVA